MVGRLRDSFSDRRLAVVSSLALLSLFVVVLVAVRIAYTGSPEHAGIVWNLFLAWIPFAVALLLYERARRGASLRVLLPLAALWLLFFPNAPYLVTDLKHVGNSVRVPVLYDVVLLAAGAWAGLLLGLTSLFLVHAVARRLTNALNAWALVVGVLAVSSFGVYLGRVERWNSWDVIVRPHSLGHQLAAGLLHPLSHPRPLGLTVLFTAFLLVSYLVFYSFVRVSSFERE